MSKQHTRSDAGSLIQQAFFTKPISRTGDTRVQSKHISKIFFIWTDNTSIYHHANNFEEPRDLQKQTVLSYQWKRSKQIIRSESKSNVERKHRRHSTVGQTYIQQQLICFKVLVSEGPTKKHKTSRKQTTLRINSDSADITRVPRPSKSTHHHECKPKQKQSNVGVMSEKPNSACKISNSNHLKEQKLHLRKILSSQR